MIGSFIAGLFLTHGDAKAILFYASLFPLFIDLTTVSTAGLIWIVALTIATVGGVKVAYALSARRLVTHLQRRNGLRYMPKAAGGILVGVGAYLLARHG
jgi:threonine/homoserine/homoserine lactone efflux protein